MNNERTITLENVGTCPIGLKDTQGRRYNLGKDAKIRIAGTTLMDIIDYPASRIFFNEGKVKVSNVSLDFLLSMGLTEEEAKFISLDDYNAVVITESIEEEVEEVIIPIVEEEVVEEEPVVVEEVKEVVAPVAPKAPAKKPAAKKTSSKKKSNK